MTDIEEGSQLRMRGGELATVRSTETKPDGVTWAYVDVDGQARTPDGVPCPVTELEVMPPD